MFKKASIIGVAATAMLLTTTPLASASSVDDNYVARDSGGSVVRTIGHGTCVRTKWEAGTDVCAPPPPPAPPPPAPVVRQMERTVLSAQEKTVYFAFDSAELTEAARQQLDAVADRLRQAKDVRQASIVGYADRKGASSYNVSLSEKRAQAVKDYLAQRGYLKTELAEVRGLGATNSQTDCEKSLSRSDEIACLGPDRRVEVEVQYLDTQRYTVTE